MCSSRHARPALTQRSKRHFKLLLEWGVIGRESRRDQMGQAGLGDTDATSAVVSHVLHAHTRLRDSCRHAHMNSPPLPMPEGTLLDAAWRKQHLQ
jgi:hypothetical protein